MRLEHVALDEVASQNKARGDIALADGRSIIEKEGGQLEQLVAIGLAGITRHGTAGARRHLDEVGIDACRGAFGKIEAEAELSQKLKLPLHEQRRPCTRIFE